MSRITNRQIAHVESAADQLGIPSSDAWALRRIALTLHRWHELECGDGNDHASWAIERDDTTGRPHIVTYPHTGKSYRRAIPDRETGALKRLAATCKALGLHYYVQTDPRGGTLYLSRDTVLDASTYSCSGVFLH